MAILGLVIKRPDTVSGVALRLTEEFPRTQWTRSIAHNALPSLAKQGFVRLVEKGSNKDSKDRYEATKAGVEEFRGWLRESVAVAPALRDVLHATLALIGDEDIPWMVEAIKDQEESCRRQSEQAQLRRNEARREGLLRSRPRNAMMTYEVVLWSQTARRLERLRKDLEGGDDEGIDEGVGGWGAGGGDG